MGNRDNKLSPIHIWPELMVYSSSWPVSVSQWRAHTLHRGQRDTRLFPYFLYSATFYPFPFPHTWNSYFLILLVYNSRPFLSAAAAAVSLDPARSCPTCSHHRIPTCDLASSPPSHTGPGLVACQYTVGPYSAFAEYRFPSAQTLPPLSPPLLICTPTFCPTSVVAASPSVSTPPCIGTPPGPVPCGG